MTPKRQEHRADLRGNGSVFTHSFGDRLFRSRHELWTERVKYSYEHDLVAYVLKSQARSVRIREHCVGYGPERAVIPQLENVAVCASARPNSIQNTQIVREAVSRPRGTGSSHASVIDHVENYDWRGSAQFPPAQVGRQGQMVLELLQVCGNLANALRGGLIHQRN